ncbi:hypothetical protein, partial [Nonomuraea dietziae]|uniref:hypothetical protein n=1 Tax=Nonomuraea dietziae TaxID=65515 RepID=UPI0031DB382D
LAHYTASALPPPCCGTPSVALPKTHPLRRARHVTVCDIGRRFGARRLLPPLPASALKAPTPTPWPANPEVSTVGYVGDLDIHRQALQRLPRPCYPAVPACGRRGRRRTLLVLAARRRHPPPPQGRLQPESGHDPAAPGLRRLRHWVLEQLAQAILAGCVPLLPTALSPFDQFITARLLIDSERAALERLHWLNEHRHKRPSTPRCSATA